MAEHVVREHPGALPDIPRGDVPPIYQGKRTQGLWQEECGDPAPGTVSYKIRNNAGVALPATGGPGTRLFVIPGILLTLLAGAGFTVTTTKRRRNAA